jgi:hypothetical protein
MPEEFRKTVLYLDGIRYSVSMAEIAARRLRATLDEVAVLHAATQQAEEQVVSALLDAWALIDMCHRARELVQKLWRKLPGVQVFLRSTAHIEELRHYVQHFHTGIPKIPSSWTPLWGALSWVPTQEPTTCYTIFTGNLLAGLQAPSIAYDTHELRFASEIVLYVGTAQADLPSIATQMRKVRDCLLDWVEKHPKFTRADADTRIRTVSMLPQFKIIASAPNQAMQPTAGPA